jgi:hypothetical protein
LTRPRDGVATDDREKTELKKRRKNESTAKSLERKVAAA